MQITSKLPDHAAVVEAMLEGFVRACQVCIEAGLAPPDPTDVPDVRYQLEPPGSEDWKLPMYVMRDKWGDCEDLAGWRAGGLRATGADPGARAVVAQTGPHKLHCIVLRSDGSLEDPSRELKMRQNEPQPHEARAKRVLGAVRVVARNGVDVRTGKPYVPPNRGAKQRTSTTPQQETQRFYTDPATGGRATDAFGNPVPVSSDAYGNRLSLFDVTNPGGVPPGSVPPPGVLPPGWNPYPYPYQIPPGYSPPGYPYGGYPEDSYYPDPYSGGYPWAMPPMPAFQSSIDDWYGLPAGLPEGVDPENIVDVDEDGNASLS